MLLSIIRNMFDFGRERLLRQPYVMCVLSKWHLMCIVSEMHEQRMTKLRQELDRISQDQWKFKPIDKLIGF